jgi:hypothetical protein
VREHFVRTVADEYLLGLNPVIAGQGTPQGDRLRVRIKAERVRRRGTDRLQRARRRADWTFVGVQLDEGRRSGLLARHVRLQIVN